MRVKHMVLPNGVCVEKHRLRRLRKYVLCDSHEAFVPELARLPYAMATYRVCLERGILKLSEGYSWDGPSGPTWDTMNFMRASLVHDALCDLIRARQLPIDYLPEVNRAMYRICREDGMSRIRAWWVRVAVEMFSEAIIKLEVRR